MNKIRDAVALRIARYALQFVATADTEERAEKVIRSGLKANGLRSLSGIPARKDPLRFLSETN